MHALCKNRYLIAIIYERTTRGHKTLGIKWLLKLLFSHQSLLYLDSEGARNPQRFISPTVVCNLKKPTKQIEMGLLDFFNRNKKSEK